MDSYDAEKKFCAETGIEHDSIRGHEALEMLRIEADHEEFRLKRANPRKRNLYSQAMQEACDRMIMWFKQAEEWNITDLVSFVASHRQSCVWAVLAGKERKDQ